MGRHTRECIVCNETYDYCPTCSKYKMQAGWMTEFHDENCKNIYDICVRYNLHMLTKAEAQAALEKCDLTNKNNFKDHIKRDFNKIFAKEPKPVVAKKPKTVAKTEKTVEKTEKSHEVVNKEEENE